MRINKSAVLLALAVLTALLSCFLPLVSVHIYCENRSGAGIFVAAAITILFFSVRNLEKGQVIVFLAVMTYAFLALAVSVNIWFIHYASKMCDDEYNWIWLPAIVASYSWVTLWMWLKWNRQHQTSPNSPLRRGLVFAGLVSVTSSSVLFAGLWICSVVSAVFIDNTAIWTALIALSVTLALSGFVLGFCGKGSVRILAIFLSVVMVFAWLRILSMGPTY